MSKFYKEEKKVNESKFVAEHCEDLTFEMYISDIKASGCDVASMNELRDEFEAAGLQVTGEKGPEGVIMKVTASDPEQCESVYNILMGHGCDENYVDFVMNNPAQHDGESFADVEDIEEEIPFESVNDKKQKNAILESIKKGGCGCAPKKLNESMNDSIFYNTFYRSFKNLTEAIDGYYERLDDRVKEYIDLPEYPENTIEYGPYNSYTKFYTDGVEIELAIDEDGQNGIMSSFGFIHNANAIVGESYFGNIISDRSAFVEFESNLSESQKRSLIQYMNNATRILKSTNPNDLNESAKPRRIKRLNESMNDSLYFYELFNSETFVEDADINKVIEEIKGAARDPRLKLFQMETFDYAGDILQIGVLVNPRDLHYVTRRYPQLSEYAFPVDATYRFFEDGQVDPESCDQGTGEKYSYEDFNEFISAGYCSLDEAIEEIENALENIGYLDESAKHEVKSPFGSVKVNGKKLGECGKGELRQMLREAKQELKELKKEEKSLGEGCGKRVKNKIAKKIEKAEKLVEILEEEIKFNPKKAGAVNEAKTLWKEFTKWSKLYEAEEDDEDEEDEEKPEDSEKEAEEKEDEKEEAELEAILLTVKNIEKVNQNLIDAGIPEEHIQMIPDEEDPKQGKIRVDAEDAITLKEYLATLGIDLEEEIGAELVADEEESEEKEDDSEEGEEKKDDDKEVNDDDVEISAEDIFGDM